MSTYKIAFELGYTPAKLAVVLSQRRVLEELRLDPDTAASAELAHAVSFGLRANAIEEQTVRSKVGEAESAAAAVPDVTSELAYRIGKLAGALYEAWGRAARLAYVRADAPDHPRLAVHAANIVLATQGAWAALSAELARLPAQAGVVAGIQTLLSVAPAADATKSPAWRAGAYGALSHWVRSLEEQLSRIPEQLAPGAAPPVLPNAPMQLDDFLRTAKELSAQGPIERLMLVGAGGRLAELAKCPELANVVRLQMRKQHITDADIQALATSPYVRALRLLSIEQNQVGQAGLEALAAASATSLCSLEAVGLQLNPVGDPADRRDTTDGVNVVYIPTEEGEALEARYGRLRWLHPGPNQ